MLKQYLLQRFVLKWYAHKPPFAQVDIKFYNPIDMQNINS